MTTRLWVNLATFAVVAVAGVVWAIASLFGGDTAPVASVTVELEAAGGLRADVDVTYLGQPVGRVAAVDLAEGGVEAAVQLDRADLPAAVTATVRRRSAVGEPYLDLAPRTDAPRPPEGPALTDGDRIAVADTALPRDYSELFASVAQLFDAVEADDVATILGEVTTALDGRSGALQRILRDGAAVAATVADDREVLEAAIDEVGALTAVLADRSGPLAATFDDLADIGATLEQLGDDYTTLLGQDDAFLARSTQLLRATRGDLGCTVVSLRTVADALDDATLDDLASVLDDAPRVREIVRRSRDDREDGSTFLTVGTLLSDRPVGGEPPRRDRDPQPPALDGCEPAAPPAEAADDAALDLGDRTADPTDPGPGVGRVDGPGDDEDDDLTASTDRDATDEPPPIGWILLALGVLAVLGATRPWRVATGGR